MDHFAGMDVSVKETSVCILDDAGKIVKDVKVASEPHALLKVLENRQRDVKRSVLTSLGSSGITLVPASRSRMRSSRVSMAAWFLVQIYRRFPSILKVVMIVQPEKAARHARIALDAITATQGKNALDVHLRD